MRSGCGAVLPRGALRTLRPRASGVVAPSTTGTEYSIALLLARLVALLVALVVGVTSRHVMRHVIPVHTMEAGRFTTPRRCVHRVKAHKDAAKQEQRASGKTARRRKGRARLLCVRLFYKFYILETSATGSPGCYLISQLQNIDN